MADRWMMRGTEFENCNCAWGCPCQFGAKSTQGRCEAFMAGHIEEGYFNDTSVDGLNYAALMYWPGEVHEGNGARSRSSSTNGRTRLSEKHCERSFTASRPPLERLISSCTTP